MNKLKQGDVVWAQINGWWPSDIVVDLYVRLARDIY